MQKKQTFSTISRHFKVFNRPNIGEAVLSTYLSFIHFISWLIRSSFRSEFSKPLFNQNHKSWGVEILRESSPHAMCHVSLKKLYKKSKKKCGGASLGRSVIKGTTQSSFMHIHPFPSSFNQLQPFLAILSQFQRRIAERWDWWDSGLKHICSFCSYVSAFLSRFQLLQALSSHFQPFPVYSAFSILIHSRGRPHIQVKWSLI